jgi:hypothetical protein
MVAIVGDIVQDALGKPFDGDVLAFGEGEYLGSCAFFLHPIRQDQLVTYPPTSADRLNNCPITIDKFLHQVYSTRQTVPSGRSSN